jgi:hypothetical protein
VNGIEYHTHEFETGVQYSEKKSLLQPNQGRGRKSLLERSRSVTAAETAKETPKEIPNNKEEACDRDRDREDKPKKLKTIAVESKKDKKKDGKKERKKEVKKEVKEESRDSSSFIQQMKDKISQNRQSKFT